jgi:hypothetical protein
LLFGNDTADGKVMICFVSICAVIFDEPARLLDGLTGETTLAPHPVSRYLDKILVRLKLWMTVLRETDCL